MTDLVKMEFLKPDRFKRLPAPIPLSDTITSAESHPVPEEPDDYWREVEWMLRTSGVF